MTLNPSSPPPDRRRPTHTRSRGAAARADSGASGLEMAALLLALVGIAMRLLANPALRDPEGRAAVQAAARALFALCLRMAFRSGLKAGRTLLRMLRGTAWEDHAALVERVAHGRAEPEALPELAPPEAARIADALGRWMRRAARREARPSRARRRGARAFVAYGYFAGACMAARRDACPHGRAEAPGAKNVRSGLGLRACNSLLIRNN